VFFIDFSIKTLLQISWQTYLWVQELSTFLGLKNPALNILNLLGIRVFFSVNYFLIQQARVYYKLNLSLSLKTSSSHGKRSQDKWVQIEKGLIRKYLHKRLLLTVYNFPQLHVSTMNRTVVWGLHKINKVAYSAKKWCQWSIATKKDNKLQKRFTTITMLKQWMCGYIWR